MSSEVHGRVTALKSPEARQTLQLSCQGSETVTLRAGPTSGPAPARPVSTHRDRPDSRGDLEMAAAAGNGRERGRRAAAPSLGAGPRAERRDATATAAPAPARAVGNPSGEAGASCGTEGAGAGRGRRRGRGGGGRGGGRLGGTWPAPACALGFGPHMGCYLSQWINYGITPAKQNK